MNEQKELTLSLTKLVEHFGLTLDVKRINKELIDSGVIRKVSYESTTGNGTEKTFKEIAPEYSHFGINVKSHHRFKTECQFHSKHFKQLLREHVYEGMRILRGWEIDHLKSMWDSRNKKFRTTNLITNGIDKTGSVPQFNNEGWAYEVGFCFRDALDIINQERQVEKVKYRVWTQGPFIRFHQGDTLTHRETGNTVQVFNSLPMGYEDDGSMYEGFVTYQHFNKVGSGFEKHGNLVTKTQMAFLAMLIYG